MRWIYHIADTAQVCNLAKWPFRSCSTPSSARSRFHLTISARSRAQQPRRLSGSPATCWDTQAQGPCARCWALQHVLQWARKVRRWRGDRRRVFFPGFICGYFPFLSLLVLHRALQQLLREQVWVTKTKGSEQGMCAGVLASCTTWGDLVCQTEKSPTPVKWQEYLSSIGGGKILTASKAVMLLSTQIYTSCQD